MADGGCSRDWRSHIAKTKTTRTYCTKSSISSYPAASQYRISLQHGRDTGNGNLYRYGMDRRYHARQLERHKTEGESIFLQLLDAVHYIHAKQIVHRDLKPSNIMITHNGSHVKLIDFGLSDTDDFSILKQPAGTSGYISPEQSISRKADIRNDIFSIGCILEKILPGKAYTAIINRCKAPIAQRYANVDELKADFMAHRNSHPVSSVSQSQPWLVSSHWFSLVILCSSNRKRALASPRHITKPRRIQSSASKRVMLPHSPKANIPNSLSLPSHLLHPRHKLPNSYPRARKLSTKCGKNQA